MLLGIVDLLQTGRYQEHTYIRVQMNDEQADVSKTILVHIDYILLYIILYIIHRIVQYIIYYTLYFIL